MNKIVEKPKKYSLVERAPSASFEEEGCTASSGLPPPSGCFPAMASTRDWRAMSPFAIPSFRIGSGSIHSPGSLARSRSPTCNSSITRATS